MASRLARCMEMAYLSLMLTGLSMVKFKRRLKIGTRYSYLLEFNNELRWIVSLPSLTYWVIWRTANGLRCQHLSEVINGKV